MRKRISLCLALLFGLITNAAVAQDLVQQTRALQSALQNSDVPLAKSLAADLQAASLEAGDYEIAGYAAYVRGGIFDSENAFANAAEAYEACYEAYDAMGSAAQAIQCHYKSAQAYLSARQSGKAVSTFKKTANMLEDIGQEKSALASQVYLTLAEEVRPQKLERSPKARSQRRQAVTYATKAIAAMEGSGMTERAEFPAAYFLKGIALEDSQKFDEAIQAYEMAIELYEDSPNMSEEELRTLRSRLNIVRADAGQLSNDNEMDVRDANGDMITLTYKKKKSVKIPRVNGNQVVDGSRALAKITLGEGGKVKDIEILESTPTADFGEAFTKAAKHWVFTPPEGVDPTTIPPFNFSYVTYVRRR